mmetsp:Transcript_10866/g.40703  ORF Transcript_10866/g.40703 Transcript_10866/m.40703 type:complete len:201 (-) Transcript_10866:329-931(-)
MLRSVLGHLDGDAGRQVLHAHARLDFVHVLAAFAATSHGRDLQLRVGDLQIFDGDVFLIEDGADLHAREGSLSLVPAVVRTDAHQPMRAMLALQVAIGEVSVYLDLCGSNRPGHLGVHLVDQGAGPSAPLSVACVHLQEHVGPLRGVIPSRASDDDHPSGKGIVRPIQRRRHFPRVHLLLQLPDAVHRFLYKRVVLALRT